MTNLPNLIERLESAEARPMTEQHDGPVAWMYQREGTYPRFNLERSEDMVPAWTETPLYTRPTPSSDADERFLLAYVSKDTRIIGIDHPTEAAWSDVYAAHVALRDRLNERLKDKDLCPHKTTATPSSDMVETPRPYPHATGEGLKYQECFSFDNGSLTVRTTGYGDRAGTGWLCFPEDALEQEQDDETGKWYQVANLANSELIFLRDTLNTIFPEAMAAKDAELAELRAEIEAQGNYLDDIKQEALTAGAPGKRPTAKALAHIVRLCNDARAALGSAEG